MPENTTPYRPRPGTTARRPQNPEHRDKPPRGDDDRQRERDKKKEWERWRRYNQDRRNKYAPWLLIRYSPTDLGFRPIPPGSVFWSSPDIWVESSDPGGHPVAGEPNFVHARVFNLGPATSLPTRVDFFWADPSIGLGPANMNFIGTEWVEIPLHMSRDVRCAAPWVPTFVNNGHECLMVNCTNPMLDPIQAPFAPTLDRHVGQRNVMVVHGSAGALITVPIFINNLLPMPVQMMLTVRVEHLMVTKAGLAALTPMQIMQHVAAFGGGDENTPAGLAARFRQGTAEFQHATSVARALAATKTAAAAPLVQRVNQQFAYARSHAKLRATWTEHSALLPQTGALPHLGRLLIGADSHGGSAWAAPGRADLPIATAQLQAHEQRQIALHVTIPANTRAGEFVVAHVAQWSEGLLTGGCTVVARPGLAK